MDQKKIMRINELAKKAKNEGLTPQEKEEQNILRREYINSVKEDLRRTLESIKPGSIPNNSNN